MSTVQKKKQSYKTNLVKPVRQKNWEKSTANQFSSFNDDNKDEACDDSGATINIVEMK